MTLAENIKSMTGFGRGESMDEKRKFTVEIKSVNHRYLDLGIKIPKKFSSFESRIRILLKDYIKRGKTDLFVTYEDYSEDNVNIKYNPSVAREYYKYLQQMAEEFGLENDIRLSTLSRYPDVFTLEEAADDEEEIFKLVEVAIKEAANMFVESRIKEGEALRDDLLDKLSDMRKHVEAIELRSPVIVEEYRKKLHDKVADLLGDATIDESRIVTEVTIFADKVCVDEEIVRLKSHIKAMEDTLKAGGDIGRKLDFIAQEMNREANTTLSKANDLTLSDIAIELKTLIEKIREQVQNIE